MKSSVFVVFIAPAAVFALLLEYERPSVHHLHVGVVDTTAREAVHDFSDRVGIAPLDRPGHAGFEKRPLAPQERRRQSCTVVVIQRIDDVRHGVDCVAIVARARARVRPKSWQQAEDVHIANF